MIIAVAVWNNRISPVFDVAQNLLLVNRDNVEETARFNISLAGLSPAIIIETLKRYRVEIVVCGAISEVLQRLLTMSGIRVEPWICGNSEEIIQALAQNRLSDQCYHMPGCCRFQGKGIHYHKRRQNRGK